MSVKNFTILILGSWLANGRVWKALIKVYTLYIYSIAKCILFEKILMEIINEKVISVAIPALL